MRFLAILNMEGGSLRTADGNALSAAIRDKFTSAGHRVDISLIEGRDLNRTLDRAVADPQIDAILIGGGDGSVSATAARLMNTGKVMAILPAGTMNLFARSLRIPLDLDSALDALAAAPVRTVDIATANGRPFIHQYSIGMHAELVQRREEREFTSRLGKLWASSQAALDTMMDPPRINVGLRMPGGVEIEARTSAIGITNNVFGEGHLPYTDTPDGGTLGVYITKARTRGEMILFLAKMALGRWKTNAQVEIHRTQTVIVEMLSSHRQFQTAIDGELADLEARVDVMIHPGALKVLRPADAAPIA